MVRLKFAIRDLITREYLLKITIVLGGYFLCGRLGLSVPFTDWNVSPVWPPAGIALAAVLGWGYRVWPGIALGAFLVNFFSPIPHSAAFGIAIGNTSSALVAGYLLHQIVGFNRSLLRLRDVLALATLGAGVGTAVAATAGTITLYLSGLRPWSAFSSSWLMWWAGDGIGVLLFTPLLLSATAQWFKRMSIRQLVEAALLLLGAFGVAGVVFDERLVSKTAAHVLAFGLFPFAMWTAVRFGLFGTSLLGSAVALIAVRETASGRGPFVQFAPLENSALLQVFLGLISLTGMVLAAVVRERQAAENALAREQQLLREREKAEAERNIAEEALLRSEKLAVAGRFAATIAHEINNPLSAITNIVHLLGTSPMPEVSRQLVATLEKEVARVCHVARQTLSFYRETTSPVRLRLADTIEEILRLYAPRFEQQDVKVEKRFFAAGEVEAYPVEMHQVFSNLLLNAMP
jgi:integral membrane sensor domain MASE1